jgi:DNA-binding NtrC family response regulator
VGSRQGVLTGLHVLVVEDDRDGREILRSVLTYFGALVTATDSADIARKTLRYVETHVVIADMHLKKGSGLTLLKRARQDGSGTPFIAISGQDFDAAELEREGFAAYLRKPLDHNTLVDTILAVIPTR